MHLSGLSMIRIISAHKFVRSLAIPPAKFYSAQGSADLECFPKFMERADSADEELKTQWMTHLNNPWNLRQKRGGRMAAAGEKRQSQSFGTLGVAILVLLLL
jgi:hypothetical protein